LCRPPRTWNDPERHLEAVFSTEWYRLITRLTADFTTSSMTFFGRRNIDPMLSPVTTQAVSSPMGLGSDSLPVKIHLNGSVTFLADSMQFHLEALLRLGFQGVYYIMPTFRGEDHDARHLNQFFHVESEICGTLEDVQLLIEEYVRHLAQTLLTSPRVADVCRIAGSLNHVEAVANGGGFSKISYVSAQSFLEGISGALCDVDGYPVITSVGEQVLIDRFGDALWLMNPPAAIVPFYQKLLSGGAAAAADLLLTGVGEVVGCGARHIDDISVREALLSHRVDEEAYSWYLWMKHHRPLETAGFGLGVERFLCWALRHNDVRDIHPMVRLKGVPAWM
jgi:asparaginyl-tRNA synthetase